MHEKAKMFLTSYEKSIYEIQTLNETIVSIRERATRNSASLNPDKVQTSRSNDMIGDAAASIADNEIVLAHAIVQSAAILKQLIKVIMQIPDVRMQCLLMYRYVCLKKWKQIPECMGYAERNIFSLHDQALQEVEKILQT